MPSALSPCEVWGIALTRRNKKAPNIKWSLFVSFTALTVVLMLLMGGLQFLLLRSVYSWSTEHRMQSLLYELALDVQEEDFALTVAARAEEAGTAAVVYRVSEDSYMLVAEAREVNGVSQQFTAADVHQLYQKTQAEEGMLQERAETLFGDRMSPRDPEHKRLISTYIVTTPRGETYFILLDTDILPLHAIFHFLKNQLMLVSLISLAISAGIAFLLARHVAAPIERINSKAKRLPLGEYDIDFSEKSYREIEELSATLNHTADDLSRTDRLQKELIANISHDLRTPLTMIVGYAEVMRDIEGENTPENMQVIIDEATRLSALVNDLLEISRIQGGSNERKNERFDLGLLVTETIERYRRLKENSGFEFSATVEENCCVFADKEKILQVICNLINNAINYSDDDKNVNVRVFKTESAVRLEVIDHGIGIAPENIEHIWERYYREETTHRRSVAGSGLGLSIVRDILELHHARYGVSSVLGEGSVFWFEIWEENEQLCPECV